MSKEEFFANTIDDHMLAIYQAKPSEKSAI